MYELAWGVVSDFLSEISLAMLCLALLCPPNPVSPPFECERGVWGEVRKCRDADFFLLRLAQPHPQFHGLNPTHRSVAGRGECLTDLGLCSYSFSAYVRCFHRMGSQTCALLGPSPFLLGVND